jgi:hypothetical protein
VFGLLLAMQQRGSCLQNVAQQPYLEALTHPLGHWESMNRKSKHYQRTDELQRVQKSLELESLELIDPLAKPDLERSEPKWGDLEGLPD